MVIIINCINVIDVNYVDACMYMYVLYKLQKSQVSS